MRSAALPGPGWRSRARTARPAPAISWSIQVRALDQRIDGADDLRHALADADPRLPADPRRQAAAANHVACSRRLRLHRADRDQHLVVTAGHRRAEADHV